MCEGIPFDYETYKAEPKKWELRDTYGTTVFFIAFDPSYPNSLVVRHGQRPYGVSSYGPTGKDSIYNQAIHILMYPKKQKVTKWYIVYQGHYGDIQNSILMDTKELAEKAAANMYAGYTVRGIFSVTVEV